MPSGTSSVRRGPNLSPWAAIPLLALVGCELQSPIATGTPIGHATYSSEDGNVAATPDIRELASRAPFTVVTFFSARCAGQRAHDGRLRRLYEAFAPQGVAFVAIDAEADASYARAEREQRARRYPYPLLADPSGASIELLGAEDATYTVILDRVGVVRYSGGIDSDSDFPTSSSTPYLRLALQDLLSGRPVQIPHGDTYGCALER